MFCPRKKTNLLAIIIASMLFGLSCQKTSLIPDTKTTLNVYTSRGTEEISKVINLRNGGTAVIGNILNIGFLTVLDSIGNELMHYEDEGYGVSNFVDLLENEESELIVLGTTSQRLAFSQYPYMLKLDQNGEFVWKSYLEFSLADIMPSIKFESDNTFTAVGSSYNRLTIRQFAMTGQTQKDFIIQNISPIPPGNDWWTNAKDFCIGPNGNYFILAIGNYSGAYKEVDGIIMHYYKLAVVEVDRQSGEKIKQTTIDDFPISTEEFYDYNFSKIYYRNNSFFVLSEVETEEGNLAARLFKFDEELSLVSDKVISPTASFKPTQFSPLDGNSFTICGTSFPNSVGSQAVVSQINDEGTIEWTSTWGGEQSKQIAYNAKSIPDGFQIFGTTIDNQSDLVSFISYKLNSNGVLQVK